MELKELVVFRVLLAVPGLTGYMYRYLFEMLEHGRRATQVWEVSEQVFGTSHYKQLYQPPSQTSWTVLSLPSRVLHHSALYSIPSHSDLRSG